MATKQQHGTVQIKRPGDEKPRTIAATLWQLDNNPFKKQGYVLHSGGKPVGVPEKLGKSGKKAAPVQDDPGDEQPETNVEEG